MGRIAISILLLLSMLQLSCHTDRTAARTSAVAAPAAQLADGSAASAKTASLVPSGNAWGKPPQQDWPLDIIQPLKYEGWYRSLGVLPAARLLAMGPARLIVSTDTAIRAYQLLGGDLLWEFPLRTPLYPQTIAVDGQYLAATDYGTTIVLELSSGKAAPGVQASRVKTGGGWIAGPVVSMTEDEPQRRLDSCFSSVGVQPRQELIGKDYAALLGQTYPAHHDYWGVNTHLAVVKLSGAKPVPGETRMLEVPQRYDDLVARFYAAADPLGDPQLMQEIVAAGNNGYAGLLEKIKAASGPQLDALIGLAAYIDAHQASQQSALPPSVKLFDAIRQWNDPRLAPRLASWASRAELAPLKGELLGLAANTASPEAAKFLRQYYDKLSITKLELPKPPFTCRTSSALGGDAWQSSQAPATAAVSVAKDGSTYTAFVAEGLASERDIYMGCDSNGDGKFELVLPTGLSDTYFYNVHPGGQAGPEGVTGSLSLKPAADGFSISHHQPVLQERSYDDGSGRKQQYLEMTGAKLVTTTLALRDLQQDGDSDGLTDLLEQQLFTDPAKADTDGDGTGDGQDPAPGVNPQAMGKLERGAARALALFFQSGPGIDRWWQDRDPGFPWTARYIQVEGTGPVAFSASPHAFGICLPDKAAVGRYTRLLKGYNAYTSCHLGYMASVPNFLDGGKLAAVSTMATPAPPAGPKPGSRSVFMLDFELQGFMIEMVEIDGELYPVSIAQTWIS